MGYFLADVCQNRKTFSLISGGIRTKTFNFAAPNLAWNLQLRTVKLFESFVQNTDNFGHFFIVPDDHLSENDLITCFVMNKSPIVWIAKNMKSFIDIIVKHVIRSFDGETQFVNIFRIRIFFPVWRHIFIVFIIIDIEEMLFLLLIFFYL